VEFAYTFSGAAPVLKKYQVNATTATVGVPLLIPGAGNAGLVLATTTGAADMVGINYDTATYVTSQQTDGTSAQRRVTVCVNPDIVYRIKLSGGATEDTALALQTVTTASTTGLAVTTAAEWSNPTFDEGVTWGYDGANAGAFRKVTSVSSTAGTVTVAFDQDTVVGDNFLRAPYWYIQTLAVQLTTLLTQADASIAAGTGAGFKVVDMDLKDQTDSGRTNSYIYIVPTDHVWGPRPT
jgi:hypothetical protein